MTDLSAHPRGGLFGAQMAYNDNRSNPVLGNTR
jgi:hypothetical protein